MDGRFGWALPALGGLCTGLIGTAVFVWSGHLGIFGNGYDDLSLALFGELGLALLIVLFLGNLPRPSSAMPRVEREGCSAQLFFWAPCWAAPSPPQWTSFLPARGPNGFPCADRDGCDVCRSYSWRRSRRFS